MSEPINAKPLCKSIVKKAYTKTCERKGCGNVYKTSVLHAKHCGAAECRLLVMAEVNEKHRKNRPAKKNGPTKGVKIRAEEKTVPIAQKWLSMPMRKP